MNSGIYVHIPFCVKKCNYCDFNSYDNINNLKQPYVDRLIAEIKDGIPSDYDTVFIGGGTPSSLSLSQLLSIVKVTDKGADSDSFEFTVEVNPATVDVDGFIALKNAGVNRISFGLQSANDDELKILGRIHTFSDFLESYSNARSAGFDNINIDLMFSLPNQTLEKWKYSLQRVVDLSPEHISCYSLIVEEGTPFFDMELNLPLEEDDRQMYHFCVNFLKEHGYKHYEISNFAKDGFECKHNLKYWERKPYYGFGAGAHSLIDNIRYENSRNVNEYINANKIIKTNLAENDIENEFIFLGLRKTSGINLSEYKLLFENDFTQKYAQIIEKYKDFCVIDNNRFYLTLDGISVSNTILSSFLR